MLKSLPLKNDKYNKMSTEAKILLIGVLFLALFGILMVYSASSYSAEVYYNNSEYFLIKQATGVFVGIIFLVFLANFDYKRLEKLKWILLGVGFVLLVLVFVPGIGVSNYGARRWIRLPGFTIQPSEIAKFCFIIFVASYLSKAQNKIKKFKGLLPVILVGGSLCLLIMLEPNMSITMCVGLVMIVMLFVGGMRAKHFFILSIPAVALVFLLIIIEPYRLDRLMAFINPWASPKGEGYQLIQSLYSLGSGGLFGVGLFNSRQKYLFLPFSESDFIFSIIGEEFGLIGSVFVLLVFLIVIIFGIKIGLRAKDRFGCLLSVGISSIIAVQVLLNVAVVTGSIPPTGLPLPFISAGSTSLMVFMGAIGVLLNVDRQSRKSKF